MLNHINKGMLVVAKNNSKLECPEIFREFLIPNGSIQCELERSLVPVLTSFLCHTFVTSYHVSLLQLFVCMGYH